MPESDKKDYVNKGTERSDLDTTAAPAAAPVLLPTHTCFDDALDLIAFRLQHRREDKDRLVLVHAICLAPDGPHAGERFAHAWVEEGELAWQDGFLGGKRVTYGCDRHALAEGLRVQHVTRYTVQEASDENHRTGTYGPWVPEYQGLCGSQRVYRREIPKAEV